MPHDCNGTELRVGDAVNLPCKVTDITSTSDTGCNIMLEGALVSGTYQPVIAVNAKQVEKVVPAPEPVPESDR